MGPSGAVNLEEGQKQPFLGFAGSTWVFSLLHFPPGALPESSHGGGGVPST